MSYLMDCREFRNKHVAFVDDLLSAVEMDAMQRHVIGCARCSRHDTAIRRSLLLVRNLPPIQPSRDFVQRLNVRLAQLGPVPRDAIIAPRATFASMSAFAALAAGVVAVAYMSVATMHYFDSAAAPSPAPTVAVAPEPVPPPAAIANAAFVASVPTGIPIWPAVLMAGEAPGHFANMDLRENESAR
ncbi:MAG TPA: zf-HC2 domain-containing protein [Gemmatimonadaceae bacterium]|nr:zf-HC2 domain-containing protein [Gemmatimonadaceae bacterium]